MQTLYYLGPKGTFSYLAAQHYAKQQEEPYHFIPKANLYEVVHAVSQHDGARALVPIENSIEGTINIVADALTEQSLVAIDEVHLDIEFALYAHPNTTLANITHVYSIAPAISQTHHFLQQHNLSYTYVDSTMQGLAHIDANSAAIAPMGIETDNTLHVLAQNIEDYPHNTTRFLVLSTSPTVDPSPTDMLLLITPEVDKPGLLASVLNTFSLFQINLSWIASRPLKTQLGKYRFFVQADIKNKTIEMDKVITILQTLDFNVKIIGQFHKRISCIRQ